MNGADSVLFVYYDNTDGNVYLARREDGQGDPTYGVPLSDYAVKPSRPAVSGNGAVGVFVSGLFDMGIIPTDGSAVETTLGYPGQIASVGMAPDGKHYAFVLQDPATGQRQNRITYFDTTGTGSTRTITLTASSDAGPVNAIYYADTLCFTPDNRYIVYDALNLIRVNGGTSNQVWSIYAYDLQQDRTLTIVNPAPGMDIGNPSVGRTDGALIVFEARSQQTGVSKVIAANLRTGAKAEVGSVTQVLAWPCYNGDDSAIVYSQGNSSVPTGSSLVRQPLGSDHVTPTGQVVKWVAEGACGFVYRRGTYTAPAAQKNADLIVSVVSTPDPVPLGNNITFNVTVSNSGPDDATGVILLDTLPANTAFVSGAVSQGNASNSNGKVTCAFGNLAKGSTASATIVVSATAQGPALDGANVVADQADSNPANNTASVTVNVGTGPSSALLVVQVSPANGGTASGGGTFPVGSQQQISATPNPGWAFSQWQDGNTQNPRTVTIVAGGYKYTANFTNATASSIIPFSNSAAITINDNAPASPYPSTITVAGHSGPIQSATVTLHGLTHTWPHDVGALLVSPGGQKIVLLADAGGGNAIANVELTFDDSTAAGLTENDAITSGTHKPSSCGTGDTFPSPAPSSPYGTNLRALNGTDPNGVWSLFVLDDQAGESGSLAGGWTLALGLPGATPPSGTPVLSVPGFLANNQFQFTLSGATGSNYEIRVSSDLTHWRVFKTVFLTGTSINITDSSVGLTRRFYSARLAP